MSAREGEIQEGDGNAEVPYIRQRTERPVRIGAGGVGGLLLLVCWIVRGAWKGKLGLFTSDRLGFNLAWVAAIYLTFQLLSIPFSVALGRRRDSWA